MNNINEMEHLFTLAHRLKRLAYFAIEEMDLGVTQMHVRVLRVISLTPSCTAKSITEFLNRDKAQITRLLNNLIEQQLVIKQSHPEDKRSQILSLTEQGKHIMKKINNMDEAIYQQMSEGIQSSELTRFNKMIQMMNDNIDKHL